MATVSTISALSADLFGTGSGAAEVPGWARFAQSLVNRRLEPAGIRVNGSLPGDPQVIRPRFYRRLLLDPSLGAGESYVDGDWDCAALDVLTDRILRFRVTEQFGGGFSERLQALRAAVQNRQGRLAALANSHAHYDLGNDLYEAMLGPSMVYTCAWFREASSLQSAQEAKLELICRKLHLQPGQQVLDIGCGWGAFARHAATHHGAHVVGVTISPTQAAWARKHTRGLPVEIRLQDYRDVRGRFDHVVTMGMFEHVGPRNHVHFMTQVRNLLREGGLFLLHCVGSLRSFATFDPWMDRYIFPGAVLPSAGQITKAAEGRLVLEDWHEFGVDYDRTLLAWYANFEEAWPSLRARYGERFFRLWRYYLLTCAGTFRARYNQLWQVVFSRGGVPDGYRRVAS